MKRGLLPLSVDPVTYGHLDLIRRAQEQCDHLTIAVCNHDGKMGSYTFTLEERAKFLISAMYLVGLKAEVLQVSKTPIPDLFLRENCDVIFRGVRSAEDQEDDERNYELHNVLLPGIKSKVVYIQGADWLRHVSSSAVKSLVVKGADVSTLVPVFVKYELERKLLSQYKIGVTGGVASGKSFVCEQLVKSMHTHHMPMYHLCVDQLVRDLYDEVTPAGDMIRDYLATKLGVECLNADRKTVDRKVMMRKLFLEDSSGEARADLNTLLAPHLSRKYREAVRGRVGIILFEWAMIAEEGLEGSVNNHVIVVSSPEQEAYAKGRGVPPEVFEKLQGLHWPHERVVASLQNSVDLARIGKVIEWENPNDIVLLRDQILNTFNIKTYPRTNT